MYVAFEAPAEARAPQITAEQQADLDCLSVAVALKAAAGGSQPLAERLRKTYLGRLQRSDPALDWSSLAIPASETQYGWFMAQTLQCQAQLRSPGTSLAGKPWGSMLVTDQQTAELRAEIQYGPVGYRFVVDCVPGCLSAGRYSQDISDSPIGLFKLWDGDDLVYSIWAGGSAYRVRVWAVTARGVSQVLEASSRGRPDFLSGPDGAPEIRTYEADGGTQPQRPVLWRYRAGTFAKTEAAAR